MLTFISGIICGLLANGMALTNKLSNFDCILFRRGYETLGASLRQGRYILFLVQEFLNRNGLNVQVHYFNIFLSIILVAFCGKLVAEIFKIENKLFRFLFAGVFASFISISSMVLYNFACLMYALSITFAVYGIKVYFDACSDKNDINAQNKLTIISLLPKYLLIILCFVFSMGIYQAYILMPIVIVNIMFVIDMLYDDKVLIEILKKYLCIFVILIVAYLLNAGISKIFMGLYDISFDQGITRGASDMTFAIAESFSFINLFDAYIDMLFLGIKDYGYTGAINGNSLIKLVYFISFVVAIVIFIRSLLISKNGFIKKVLSIVGLLFLPISFGLLEIIFPDMVDSLQLQHLILYIALPLIMLEKMQSYCGQNNKNLFSVICNRIITLSLILCILLYSYFANLNFSDLYNMNKIVDKEMDSLINRIISIDGYNPDKPIVFLGDLIYGFRELDRNEHMIYRGINMNNFASSEDVEFMLAEYARFKFNRVDSATKRKVSTDERVKAMGVYPDSDSIQVIDDYIVVKFYKK